MGLDENSNEMHVKNENLLELRKKYYDGLELIRENIKNYIKGVRNPAEPEPKQKPSQTEEEKPDSTRENTGKKREQDDVEVFFAINEVFIDDGLVPPEYYLQSLDKNETCDFGGHKMFKDYFLNIPDAEAQKNENTTQQEINPSEKQNQKYKPGENWRFIQLSKLKNNNQDEESKGRETLEEIQRVEVITRQLKNQKVSEKDVKAETIILDFKKKIKEVYNDINDYFLKLNDLRKIKYAKLKKDYQYLLCYAFRLEELTLFEVFIFIRDIESGTMSRDPKKIAQEFTKRSNLITEVLKEQYLDEILQKGINDETQKKLLEVINEYTLKSNTAEAARIQLMGNFIDRFRLLTDNQVTVEAIMDTFENALRRWVSVTEIAMVWGYVYHFPNLLIGPLKEKIDKLIEGKVEDKDKDSILYLFDIVSSFVSFANEIEYTIQLGWNNAVNAFMTELVNHEANTGNDWNKVLDDAEACIFFTRTGEKKNILNNPQEPILQNMVNAFKAYFDDIITPMRESMIKTALAAVIGRNMSHNIGSHVLARLSSKNDIEKNNIAKNPIHIACLNSYLRTRMDFIADVATSVPIWASPKKLYSDVLQFFMPVPGEDPNNEQRALWPMLLIDNIGGGVLNRKGVKIDKDYIQISFESKNKDTTNTTDKDIPVLIPNDILGSHALYVIVENIIRNSLKHNKGNIDDKYELKFIIGECEKYKDDYYEICIEDNIKIDEQQFKKIEKLINDSIIDIDTREVRKSGWGLLEMKLATLYLRRADIKYYDVKCPENMPKFLEAYLSVGNILGYKFYLQKPKIDLIITALDDLFCNNHNKKNDQRNKDKQIATDYEFVVVPENNNVDMIKYCKENNLRYVIMNKTEIINKNIKEKRKILWQKRVEQMSNKITIKNKPTKNEENIIHNNNQNSTCEAIFDCHGDNKSDNSKTFYYEEYGSADFYHIIFENIKSKSEDSEILICELIETIMTQCIILDERIQETIGDKEKDIIKQKGIIIPKTEEINLTNLIDYNQLKEFIEKCIQGNPINEKTIFYHYLVIHIGVLEAITGLNTEEDPIKTFIKEYCKKLSIIVISGRGTPPNLPDHVCFLPFSVISRYVTEQKSKYHLVKALYSARRK